MLSLQYSVHCATTKSRWRLELTESNTASARNQRLKPLKELKLTPNYMEKSIPEVLSTGLASSCGFPNPSPTRLSLI